MRYVEWVPDELDEGQIWRAGAFAQTARVGSETIKSWRGLGGSEASALEALDSWQALGFKGNPASPASFYRKMYDALKRLGEIPTRTNATVNNLLAEGFYGGWIELVQPGYNAGPIYHYDLNRAYYWAGVEGLPAEVRYYQPGDKCFMVLAEIRSARHELPVMIEQRRRRVLLTHEDLETYGIDARISEGVSWDPDGPRFYPEMVLDQLAGNVPAWIYKRAGQSYWGVHAQRRAITREIWKGGQLVKRLPMRNRHQNILWAQLIISRVTRRVYEAAAGNARQVYVDSILSPVPMETSDRIGGWKLVGEFPRGVLARAPGVWTPFPVGHEVSVAEWHKHAGYSDVV